jgi:hypothetical protein
MRTALRLVAVVLVVLGVLYLQVEIRWGVMLLVLAAGVWWYGDAMHEWRRVARAGCMVQIAVVLKALLVSVAIGAVAVYMVSDLLEVWMAEGGL